jgi:hypothetical protein
MKRRNLLTLVGTGIIGVVIGYIGSDALDIDITSDKSDYYNHQIRVWNNRETVQEIKVEYELDGAENKYGPKQIKPDSKWNVDNINNGGELTINFYLEGNITWQNTHHIPTPHGKNGYSMVGISLHQDEEIETHLLVTD